MHNKHYIPKQWPDWIRSANLRPEARRRDPYAILYLKGRGRYWRINRYGILEMGERYETFDQWANSTVCSLGFVPKYKETFVKLINAVADKD